MGVHLWQAGPCVHQGRPRVALSDPPLLSSRPQLGSEPHRKALQLNSHYDVVPAEATKWTMGDPWAATLTPDGWLVGRGTQDMKSVCVQHLEALHRAANRAGGSLARTVHITMVPDEEIGGRDGLGTFVKSDAFAALNVGCALDEGLANPNKGEVTVFYGERAIFWIRIKASGNVGHGSRFIKDQVGACMCLLSWHFDARLPAPVCCLLR